MGSPNYIRKSA